MVIIALIGPSSCGKTSTLNIVYSELKKQGGVPSNRQQLGSDLNDFSDIVLWNEKKIAFFTMGDYATFLIEAIKKYNNQNCDLLICACNDCFVRPFIEFKKYNTCQIIKQKEPNKKLHEAANASTADEIFNKIV
jgi:ABC-type cobalamin/Fe3+-siderophores transport system ATPase subunit